MMTHTEFDAAYARLVALHGCTARDASGKRAQSFARLYVESGWTQEALAEKEKMSQQHISRWLIFGRFLLTPIGCKEINCSERQFRELWDRTDKTTTEEARFSAVEALLQEEKTDKPRMKWLGKQIVAQFTDGKYHRVRDIASALDADISMVRGICDRIVSQGTFQTFGERRPAPTKDGSYAYRFVKGGKKKIDLAAFYAEAKPVLDEMENVINGHSVHFSQQLMKVTFAQFRQVIDRVVR